MAAPTTNGITNGVHGTTTIRPLKPGIYAPIPSFYLDNEDQDLDVPTFQSHIQKLALAGVHPVVAGSMGEAIHLSHSERSQLIRAARKALDDVGCYSIPIIAGTGAGSTRETIELSKAAAAAGADCAIVIASGYFAGVLANSREALLQFYREVADKSPIPVMIYNYPGASGGIDLDSDIIIQLAKEHSNICGVKLTCGAVGKLTRISTTVNTPHFISTYPRKHSQASFLVLGGYCDFLVPSSAVGGHGCITGLANVAPYTITHLWNLIQQSPSLVSPSASSKLLSLQYIVSQADFTIAKSSIAGTKFLLEKLYGYGGVTRRPLPPIGEKEKEKLWSEEIVGEIVGVERGLAGKGGAAKVNGVINGE